MKDSIAAVIVTFNRLEFLKEIVDGLRKQTVKLSEIIVVNNSSSDGTLEWLRNQDDLTYVVQDNVGSSGGQYTGTKTAYLKGHEWIWIMDDDVVPKPNCLEEMLKADDKYKVVVPLRLGLDRKPITTDILKYNISNPFRNLYREIINESYFKDKWIATEGFAFEGPLFHRSVFEKAGFPEFYFFINADDAEFAIRVKKAGFKAIMARDANFQRKLDVEIFNGINPRFHYYKLRNHIALDVMHGSLPVRILRPFAYSLRWLLRCKKLSDIHVVFKSFRDGYFYKSGNNKLNGFSSY